MSLSETIVKSFNRIGDTLIAAGHRSKWMRSSSNGGDAAMGELWSADTQAVIARAEASGYVLRPKGKPPYGWELMAADRLVKQGSLGVIEAFLCDTK